jgi:hypothetical protein
MVMGLEALAACQIMAYVSWPWSAKRHNIGIGRYSFGRKYGLEANIEAFKVKGRTLYHWRRQLRMGGEDLEGIQREVQGASSAIPRAKRLDSA